MNVKDAVTDCYADSAGTSVLVRASGNPAPRLRTEKREPPQRPQPAMLLNP